ncbi:SusC/RagA family TonB-linked outer membrane protein [Larkinella humicola]|uniref:SusC/RagA family TonB-linked outer membrane protein n=1 Tax=Larkinella humicola TaxID=2607654 RepID=A0A5N1JV39_9BACT|nr:SusC/RagA family TonB-linked outer membrane protein [Larkinella humicola]KAA9357633.1 SusC/RagA family TonB-linked outer membrane protein [Larkinella humicola]
MKRSLCFLRILVLSLLSTLSFAQTVEVKGKVTEEGKSEINGVNVLIKGTTRGTITNDRGEYSIQVQKGATLKFSSIGFIPKEVEVGNSTTIDVSLTPEESTLSEVVVTALGIKKEKKALGYSVTEVKGEELTQARTVNMANSLQGKVAGLNVANTATGPGGSSRIVIRGNGSISGNNQPLIVVDGTPINNDNLGSAGMWGGGDSGDGISSLNPDEVETISVLKGATASALYGSRASNGVILVTTKGGKANKGIGVELSSNYVAENLLLPTYKDYQYEYGMGNNGIKPTTVAEALTSNSWGAKLDGSNTINFDGKSRPYSAYKNNQTDFYRIGSTFTNSVALTGATESITYRLSMNDLNNKAIIPNSGLRRNNFALNVNANLGPKLSIVTNVKYILEKTTNRPRLSDSPGSATYAINAMPTSLPLSALKESQLNDDGSEKVWSDNIYIQNPYVAANNWRQEDKKGRIIGVVEPRFNFTDWLFLRGRLGFDNFNYRNLTITPYGTPFQPRGGMNVGNRNFTETNSELLLGINKKFGDRFGINALFGGNLMKQTYQNSSYGGSNFNIPYFYDISNIDPAARSSSENYIEKRINSVYGSAEFSYNGYLFVTATARNDWFSTLAKGNNSILYPSVGGSFVVSEAFKLPTAINYLKVRASWAQAGGDTDPYNLSLYYGLSGAHLGAPLAQINGDRVPNSNLQPLTSTTSEAGLETRLFNNKLGVDFALYTRKTTNDIVAATISNTSGYGSALFNVGEIANKGLELLLTYRLASAKDFSWDASFNMGYNKSEVVSLYGNLTTLQVDENRTRIAYIHQVVGLPYSQVKGFTYKKDASGNVVYDSQGYPLQGNLVNFGTGVAPTTLGFTNSFRYKGIGLSFLIDGKFGGVIYSGTNAYANRRGLLKSTLEGRETGIVGKGVNEKGEPNTVKVPAQQYYERLFNIADPFVYSADFLKLRQVIIDYTIPTRVFGKSPFKGASISLVGRNLAILMKKTPNIDPESTYNNSNAQGLELAGVPPTRTVGVNLNLKF